ncbi:efflux RND transporter periplasmic adaptor subunit [bacterium]|nr:efflux RND transporter periplasmic adaptor subunit [bacterium]
MSTRRNALPVRSIAVVVAVLAAFGLGFALRGGGGSAAPAVPVGEAASPTRWTCSMHPQIILPSNDQKCPICFMDLIPLEEGGDGGLAPGELALSENAAALADVATDVVARRFVTRDIRLVGKVTADETRTRTITARVGGRLDDLYVDATGQVVSRGMKLAEIYSPELYTAQAELQAAARAAAAGDEDGSLAGSAAATLAAARERLRLWGMGEEQIAAIASGQGISDHLTVTAPVGGVVVMRMATRGDYVKTGSVLYEIADLSAVWITLQAFETDVPWLRDGQAVGFTTRAFPGREFAGEIQFIDPVLDERTRTVEVRVAVANADNLLKPGMLAVGHVQAALDADGLPVTDETAATPPLVIPASAPLLTGERAVVYVRRDGPDGPVFAGRQVVLGPRAGDHYLVVAGLDEGEEVVTRGSFKIDSALQILAQPSMMNPLAGESAPDHDHAGMDMAPAAVPGDRVRVDPFDAPACFGAGLGAVVDAYYPLQEALAGDDDTAARAAAAAVATALPQLECDTAGLAAAAVELWGSLRRDLRRAADATAAAGDIADRRVAFESLSDALWQAVATYRGGDLTVRRFHCPMAMDGRGAYWLQKGTTTANPYYGDAMLRCGSQVEIAGASSAAGGDAR